MAVWASRKRKRGFCDFRIALDDRDDWKREEDLVGQVLPAYARILYVRERRSQKSDADQKGSIFGELERGRISRPPNITFNISSQYSIEDVFSSQKVLDSVIKTKTARYSVSGSLTVSQFRPIPYLADNFPVPWITPLQSPPAFRSESRSSCYLLHLTLFIFLN